MTRRAVRLATGMLERPFEPDAGDTCGIHRSGALSVSRGSLRTPARSTGCENANELPGSWHASHAADLLAGPVSSWLGSWHAAQPVLAMS